MLFALLAAIATAYQIVAIVACLRFQRQNRVAGTAHLPVSILKPVRGLDPGFYEAIVSHAEQRFDQLEDRAQFEVLFGVADPNDPAVAAIERLKAAYPNRSIRLVRCTTIAPNRKVGVLIDLAREARYETFVVNDSDIRVPPTYLHDITGPLTDPQIGLVTCLYRATANTFAGKMEALGIATDFAPSTLVAPLVGVNEFGLGSTLCFRRADLQAIGGFESIAAYLADDYQLARRITTGLNKRAFMSHAIVDTSLQAETWRDVWLHQVRWHRTIRVSRPGGYAGLPATFASVWGPLAMLSGWGAIGALALGARFAMAVASGVDTLECPIARRYIWLVPLRDWFGAAVWVGGLFGNHVQWRDRSLLLTADGRIKTE